MRYFKVGGLRFLRIGRLQLSFCLCRRRRTPALDRLAVLSAQSR